MIKRILFIPLLILVLSCGKETQNTPPAETPVRGPGNAIPSRNISEFINKHQISCAESECPEYLARVFVVNEGQVNYCTGILISENAILTSSQCMPRALRIPGSDCSNTIYTLFGKNNKHPRTVSYCKRILEVDRNVSFLEPAMWKGDYLIYSLDGGLSRDIAEMNDMGMTNNSRLNLWAFDFVNSSNSVLRKRTCRVLQNTYLNPFSDNAFAPMQVATECEAPFGAQGSPLVNSDGKVEANLTAEMSGDIYTFLENNDVVRGEIQKYYHLTNTSCLSFLNPLGRKCDPELSLNRLDSLRANILAGQSIHSEDMEEVEAEIEEPRRYFVWDVDFVTNRFRNRFDLRFGKPKCILNSEEWIHEFSRFGGRRIYTYGKIELEFPNKVFKTKLNPYLRPISVIEEVAPKKITVEFNPFQAHVKKKTDVTITSQVLGQTITKIYEGVTANCN